MMTKLEDDIQKVAARIKSLHLSMSVEGPSARTGEALKALAALVGGPVSALSEKWPNASPFERAGIVRDVLSLSVDAITIG